MLFPSISFLSKLSSLYPHFCPIPSHPPFTFLHFHISSSPASPSIPFPSHLLSHCFFWPHSSFPYFPDSSDSGRGGRGWRGRRGLWVCLKLLVCRLSAYKWYYWISYLDNLHFAVRVNFLTPLGQMNIRWFFLLWLFFYDHLLILAPWIRLSPDEYWKKYIYKEKYELGGNMSHFIASGSASCLGVRDGCHGPGRTYPRLMALRTD